MMEPSSNQAGSPGSSSCKRSRVQALRETDDPIGFSEAASQVECEALPVVEFAIARELRTPLRYRPRFARPDEHARMTPPAKPLVHEYPFEIPDGAAFGTLDVITAQAASRSDRKQAASASRRSHSNSSSSTPASCPGHKSSDNRTKSPISPTVASRINALLLSLSQRQRRPPIFAPPGRSFGASAQTFGAAPPKRTAASFACPIVVYRRLAPRHIQARSENLGVPSF